MRDDSFKWMFRLVVGLQIVAAIGFVLLLAQIIQHPEAIGDWFGRLASGFKGAP